MSSNSPEAQDLLRLFKCAIDTGADVLVPFAKDKLLKPYNGNFKTFLDNKKHKIFHLWQSKKLLCCECPPAGYNIKRVGHVDNWIFRKIYDDNGLEVGGHIIRNNGTFLQVCIHKYVAKQIGIHELDISALSCLLRNMAALLPNETTALDTITFYRSKICHACSMNYYDISFLNTAWTELENALVELTDPSYKRVIQKQIKYLRKVDLEKEEIKELLENVKQEVTRILSSNNNVIEKCELNLKKTVVKESHAIQQSLVDESSSIKQAQKVVLQEVISSKAAAQESGDKILEQIDMLNSNQASINTEVSDQLQTMMKMLHRMNGTTFSIKCEQSTGLSDGGEDCLVLWQLATPENWNAAEVEEILTKCEDKFKDIPMKIKFVRKGSLVIMTTIAATALKDSKDFQSAVKAFLTRMVDVCSIDTTVKCNVDVTVHILNRDELNFTCNIPTYDKSVQTEEIDDEHQMRMKKHSNELDEFDIAFLNFDNQREIEWVQMVSKRLKAKFDIKCALLSKDYLFGFPLENRILQYLKKFQAVILPVTKYNYQQYQFYAYDKMSLIVVEIDYISEIPKNLWKFPYINGTTCEHLWFPRLVDTLKLPYHLIKRMDNDKDEQEVHCEKCKTSSKSTVYHTVEIQYDKEIWTHSVVSLCGSLADEAWILNFIYQTLNLMKSYTVFAWNKSLDSTDKVGQSFKLFVCVSPNIQKCPVIGENINLLVKDKGMKIHLLKIAQALVPRFLNYLPNRIDATTMVLKDLADVIFLPAPERKQQDSVYSSGLNVFQKKTKLQTQKNTTASTQTERSGESDDFVDKIDSLKYITASTQTDRIGELDHSEDGYEGYTQYITRVKKERLMRSAYSVAEIESLKHQTSNVTRQRYWRSVVDDSKDDYEGYIPYNTPNTSLKKDRSVRSDDSVDNEGPLESLEKSKVRSRISDSKCIIQ